MKEPKSGLNSDRQINTPYSDAPLWQRKARGQAIVVVALSMFALIAVVGLAIDGGSMFNQRRKAQNGADGASLAGSQKMLSLYESMVVSNTVDVPGSSASEQDILRSIQQYATLNGISTSADKLKAYFVNDNKQVVTVPSGLNGCGSSNPCQVGSNGSVPWTLGAKGIVVTNRAETQSFFMSLLGWNTVGGTASATAYMGVATDVPAEVGLFPVGFFTDTTFFNALQVGQTYNLVSGSRRQGAGNWGYVNFSGRGGPVPVVNAWIACGFYPFILTQPEWNQRCPAQWGVPGYGPTQYWTGGRDTPYGFQLGPYTSPTIEWPSGNDGWWIAGSTGTTDSSCQDFDNVLLQAGDHNYLIPVFDKNAGQGQNTRFHLIGLAWFHITPDDIQCKPDGGEHWWMNGTYIQKYSAGSSGHHGDVRHTSNPVVFLEP